MEPLNIHPLIIHFPIALLSLYSVLEVLRFPAVKRQEWWFPMKAILLIVGVLGGWAALATGEMVESLYRGTPTMPLVELHSLVGNLSIACYAALAASYLIAWIDRTTTLRQRLTTHTPRFWNLLVRLERWIFRSPVVILLAILGFVLLSITGALGGAIVYGPDTDPIVSVIYHLFY